MAQVFTVTLPRTMRPRFPNRCVRCLADSPTRRTRVVDFNGLSLFMVVVPTCSTCRVRIQLWLAWDKMRTILIGAAAVAFGITVLLPRLPGWATGLIVLGTIVVAFASLFIWNRVFPPAFKVDAGPGAVDYEFANEVIAGEFAALNGAAPEGTA